MKRYRLLLGTKNKNKLRELQDLFGRSRIKVLSLDDFKVCKDVIENGRTFEANAKKKAMAYSRHAQCLALADDSGLMVRYLSGRPGVYSARFAGKGCSYQDNNKKLLNLLHDVSAARRQAKFVCVMALYDHGRFIRTVRGVCHGTIALCERGENGFGYDPVFIPKGYLKTFAELSPAVKNRISHRGKALRAAKEAIVRYLKARPSKRLS